MKKRKPILTIAGFDPSGGAGILSDIKVFEQHKLLGMAVNSANTIQNDSEFLEVNWIDESIIFKQLEILLKKFKFEYIKIGLIQNFEFLEKIKKTTPDSKLILDPILKTTSGFDLLQNNEILRKNLDKLEFLTPNWNEIKIISSEENPIKAAEKLSNYCNIYLKGGHNEIDQGRDYLFIKGKQFNFKPMGSKVSEKHGSGCILSSALASNLALDYPVIKACLKAKQYTTNVLESNSGLLGYHKF